MKINTEKFIIYLNYEINTLRDEINHAARTREFERALEAKTEMYIYQLLLEMIRGEHGPMSWLEEDDEHI